MVAGDIDNMMYQVQDAVYGGSMERVASDTVNALITTSGTPQNWEITGITNSTVIGFAKFDTTNSNTNEYSLSASKVLAAAADFNLNKENSRLQNMVGSQYGFFINITSIKDNKPMAEIGDYNSSASDIIKVERTVVYSQYPSVSSLVNQIRYTGEGAQARVYSMPTFYTSSYSLQNFDYWILMTPKINSADPMFSAVTVNVNNNKILFTSQNITTAYKITSYLNFNSADPTQSLNNTITLNGTGSFPSSMNCYIVQTPTNVDSEDVTNDTVVPKNCRFAFYLWTK